jgi:hypothetical protein
MMKTLDEQFQAIPDNRTGNAVRYQSPDVLKAAFAMFSLKSPSLLDFKLRLQRKKRRSGVDHRFGHQVQPDKKM